MTLAPFSRWKRRCDGRTLRTRVYLFGLWTPFVSERAVGPEPLVGWLLR